MKRRVIDDPILHDYLNLPDDFSIYTKDGLLDLVPGNCSEFAKSWTKDKIVEKLTAIREISRQFYDREAHNLVDLQIGTPIVGGNNVVCLISDWRFQCHLLNTGWDFSLVLGVFELGFKFFQGYEKYEGKLHPNFTSRVRYKSEDYKVVKDIQWVKPTHMAKIKPILLGWLQDALPEVEEQQ